MSNSSSYLSLIKELDHIYQVLISNERFPLALKALELKGRLLNVKTSSSQSVLEMISQLSDQDLESLAKHLNQTPKKRSKDN